MVVRYMAELGRVVHGLGTASSGSPHGRRVKHLELVRLLQGNTETEESQEQGEEK